MKVYKNNLEYATIRLAYPILNGEKFLAIPYHYSEMQNKWVRSALGSGIPYATQEDFDKMEYVGDTEKDYEFHIEDGYIDGSYLTVKTTED